MSVSGSFSLPGMAAGRSPVDAQRASFYLSRVELKATDKPGMSRWRKQLFLVTALITDEPTHAFRLPPNRTVTLGSEIEF